MNNTIAERSEKISNLNIVVIILSFYVLGALLIDTVFDLPKEVSILLNYFDTTICAFFFVEFSIRFYQADNKLKFMHWGWIDLLSSIPMIGIFRVGRVFRLIRLVRVARAFHSTKKLITHIYKNKAQGALTSAAIIAFLLVVFSAIAILQVETDPNSNIKTAEDAIWWAYVSITTVGYGDKFPVTTEGRIIASILMTAGVGLFGTFTAYVASWFVIDKKAQNESAVNEK